MVSFPFFTLAPAPPSPCGCAPAPPTTPKPKIFINKQAPIVINRPAQSYTVSAGKPVVVKPAPVVIQRAGKSEVRPYVINVTGRPIVVNKKILKIDRPIIKKVFVEQYSQQEPNPCDEPVPQYPLPPVNQCANAIPQQPAPCGCGAPAPCGCK